MIQNLKQSPGHAATIQTLWSQIQSEEQIVSALTNVPVTPKLSGLVTGYLPVHCISQLINSRAPACPPNLFTWLPQQLRETEEPVPSVLCELVSGSVNFLMSNKGQSALSIGIISGLSCSRFVSYFELDEVISLVFHSFIM